MVFQSKTISLIVIAYNEEKLIIPTLKNVPLFIDAIIVIDDNSNDKTINLVLEQKKKDERITLIVHKKNMGPGAAIKTGYLWSAKMGYDIAVVVGGDNQMILKEIPFFLIPLIEGKADYCKGNRFQLDAFSKMPYKRLFGNFFLSIMTILFSGYWGIFDTQDGYTSITRESIIRIAWDEFWDGYGYVSDFIIRMKAYNIRIKDIPRHSVYLANERQSQINISKYIVKFFPLWIRSFKWRIKNRNQANKSPKMHMKEFLEQYNKQNKIFEVCNN